MAYPGGPQIERAARTGDPSSRKLPRPLLRRRSTPVDADYFDFSFSGLKTATALWVAELEGGIEDGARTGPGTASALSDELRADVSAAFQDAAVDVLVEKTRRAVAMTGVGTVTLGGGVSVNGHLRRRMVEGLGPDTEVVWASPRYSLDNGAMIALAGRFRLNVDGASELDLEARADLPFPGLSRVGRTGPVGVSGG